MRKFSQPVKTLLATGIYSGFFLIEMNIRGNPLRYTTLPYDVSVGGNLYSSDSNLAGVDPPKLSTSTDREAFKIKFADPEMTFSALCDEMINSRVSVRGGFFNTTGSVLVDSVGQSIQPNNPLLNINDTLLMYKGFIDVVRYTMSEEDGVLLEIECTSPMASLDALNSFYTTTNSLRQRVPADIWAAAPDTSFDNVSLGGSAQELLWGKI
jgi:hypothetical protein